MTTRREPAGLSKRLKDEALTMEATLSELRTQMAAERAKREQARMKAKQQGSIWRTGQTGALRGSSVKNIVRDGSGRSRPTKSNSMASHAKNRAPSATAPSPPPGVVSGRTVTPPVGLNQDASATTRAPPADESAWEMPSFMQGPPVATGIGVAGAQTGLSDASPPRAAHAGGAQAQQRRFAAPAARQRAAADAARGPAVAELVLDPPRPADAPAPGGAMGASRPTPSAVGMFQPSAKGPGKAARGKAGGAAAGEAAEVPLTHAQLAAKREQEGGVRKDPMLMATSTGEVLEVVYDVGGADGPGGSLLDGEFDEEANAREFQAALAAWRDGGDGGGSRASARARTPPRTPPKLRGPSLLDGEFDEEANAREFRAALAAWRGEGDAVPGGAAADIQTEGSQPLRPLAKPAAAEAPSSYFERIQSNMMARTAGRAAARMTTCAAPVVAAVMASARASEAGEGERGEAAEEAQDRAAEAVREWDGAESEAGVQDGSARAAAGPRAVPDDDSDDDAPPPMPRELPPAPDGNVAEGVSAPDATHPPEAPPEAGPPPEAATPAPRSDPEGHGGYDLLAMLREGAAGDDAQPISASLPPPPAPRASEPAEPAPRARAADAPPPRDRAAGTPSGGSGARPAVGEAPRSTTGASPRTSRPRPESPPAVSLPAWPAKPGPAPSRGTMASSLLSSAGSPRPGPTRGGSQRRHAAAAAQPPPVLAAKTANAAPAAERLPRGKMAGLLGTSPRRTAPSPDDELAPTVSSVVLGVKDAAARVPGGRGRRGSNDVDPCWSLGDAVLSGSASPVRADDSGRAGAAVAAPESGGEGVVRDIDDDDDDDDDVCDSTRGDVVDSGSTVHASGHVGAAAERDVGGAAAPGPGAAQATSPSRAKVVGRSDGDERRLRPRSGVPAGLALALETNEQLDGWGVTSASAKRQAEPLDLPRVF